MNCTNQRILIFSHDHRLAAHWKSILSEHGLIVVGMTDVAAAIARLNSDELVDLALIDFSSPLDLENHKNVDNQENDEHARIDERLLLLASIGLNSNLTTRPTQTIAILGNCEADTKNRASSAPQSDGISPTLDLFALSTTSSFNNADILWHPFPDEKLIAKVSTALDQSTALADHQSNNQELREAKRVAEEGERRFRMLADSMSTLCWTTELDSNCSWLNRRWLDYCGRPLQEQTGYGWMETVHPDDRESTREAYMSAFEKQVSFTVAYRLLRHDGIYRWHSVSAAPRFDDDGNFNGYVGSSLDDHDARISRAALEKSERSNESTLRVLIDNSDNFLARLDVEGNLLEANRTALTAIDSTLNDVLNQPFWETPWWNRHAADRDRIQQAIQRAALGNEDHFEVSQPLLGGSNVDLAVTVKPIINETNVVIGLLAEGRDITEYKKRAEESARLNRQLEIKNLELEQFIYVASHDLREPLRAVSGFTQLLEVKYQNELDERGKSYISHVVAGVGRMQQLIDDLLHFSRVSREQTLFTKVDLNVCVESARKHLMPLIESSNAELDIGKMPVISGIQSQLTQLFQNLIGNAVKYRKESVPPRIEVKAETDHRFCTIRVQDNGIGIEPKHFSQIFVLFKRLHRREEYPGTGIGLAICQRIAERHNGSISVDSWPNEGACFNIKLPIQSA